MFERMVKGPGAFVTVCLLAPVVEEMLFRGIILRSFLHQYPSRPAIAGSAFIFGLAHLNLYQFVTAFLFGLVAGWLYERSRSLWPPILLHAACNFTSVVAWYHRDMLEAKVPGMPPALWIGAFLLAFVGTTLLQRIFNPARSVAAE